MPIDEHLVNQIFQTVKLDVFWYVINITYEHWGIRYFNLL